MKTKIYAHRGASRYAPENTMPAFQLAYEMKADGIETDVQLTKDGVPVLIHDENVRRTTNGTGFVEDYTLEEIKQLDAGSWFSSKYAGTSIVTLEELLQWAKPKQLLLNIELKNNVIEYKKLEQKVYQLLFTYDLLDRTVISSFNPKSIEKFKKIDRNVNIAFLTSTKIRRLANFTKLLGASGIHIKYRILSTHLVGECQKHGLDLRVYTVNRPAQIVRCYKLGCTAIFTDVPDIAVKLLLHNQSVEKVTRKFPFRRR
ncbi:glycerophosphoryl diester phosphodiesterase [Salirhabdus euzebyi]|uniref:Glycerophosphoryl diester phosphodiesterase n=1 Tax=Salirhabdus euzebyi TaxID=394506 RepID=A0A841QAN0_9BACI|nr:glycerophosphodiester phosphodiesterase [Salirhabdus euzebyi]MBB6455344.1 glycerophosphoryl diester phosphodiesterase [Salirhabdus euzebyi]